MRVFISSTPDELEPHRVAACEVAHELGLEPVVRDPAAGRGLDPVTACARQVASADLLLAIVGWRRGGTPPPELGGDGLRPWTFWEVRSAFDHGKPVSVLMAAESWRPELREDDTRAHAVVQDLRGELHRLAVLFSEEPDDIYSLGEFRALVRHRLLAARRAVASRAAPSPAASPEGPELRRWPPSKLPERPYPLLLPYTHPDLMAGRERELDQLRLRLQQPAPILGLYGLSGTGKSSLLTGGLVPALRAAGRPVALDRYPCESGIAGRLLADLLLPGSDSGTVDVADDDGHAFVDRLLVVRRLAGVVPILVVDQFEDLLRQPSEERARAVMGILLAATAQRQPGLDGPPCRWLLAYRQEFHGRLFLWLGDALQEARRLGLRGVAALPSDLSGPERFQGWPLQPFGTPPPGAKDRAGEAARTFQAAIEKPLELLEDGCKPRYPWRFAEGGAERLARAFGEARAARPGAPLVPELQVVLAHLLEKAGEPTSGRPVTVEVPDDPGTLVDQALENHLRRALDAAFPTTRKGDSRLGKTRALLALRALADVQGHREAGLPADSLARAIALEGRTRKGREILDKLSTPQTRLVLLEEHGDGWRYVLSHDRMAEVVVRQVDHEEHYADLGVDAELLGLRRFVELQSELFRSGEVVQATEVPAGHFHRIEQHADALLWGKEARRWWQACRKRRYRNRRQTVARRSTAVVAVVLLAVLVGTWARHVSERRELLEAIADAEPETSFGVLADLTADADFDAPDLLAAVRQREQPFDVLEHGLGGVDEEQRGAALLRVVRLFLPLVEEEPEDPVRIASTVWALDFFALPDPALRQQATALRQEVLRGLRRRHPPPPPPAPDDPEWADVPAGAFLRGHPGHTVQLSPFRLMVHEVTNAEYRRLVPEPAGQHDLPVVQVNWYQAYTYAAWLGGRLPTEAEWEYAARAGCRHTWCRRDGTEATLNEVAWWVGRPGSEEPSVQPVMQLEPNPWGLYDVLGNVREICADWDHRYSERPEVDPSGPTTEKTGHRIVRGGSVWWPHGQITATQRDVIRAGAVFDASGFRVALPPAHQK